MLDRPAGVILFEAAIAEWDQKYPERTPILHVILGSGYEMKGRWDGFIGEGDDAVGGRLYNSFDDRTFIVRLAHVAVVRAHP